MRDMNRGSYSMVWTQLSNCGSYTFRVTNKKRSAQILKELHRLGLDVGKVDIIQKDDSVSINLREVNGVRGG